MKSALPSLALLLLSLLTGSMRARAQTMPSLVDPAFNSGVGANGDVFAIARDADGRFVVAGEFVSFAGINRGRLARLTANGVLDPGFFNGQGANAAIYAVAVQADGKILVGGTFTTIHGQIRNYLARLESDGSIDFTFVPPPINNELRAIAVEPDGRVLIAGRFTQVDGQARNHIARLLTTGALDASFQPGTGADDNIRALLRLVDGRILIGGQFTKYDGTTRNRIARLLSTGGLDTSFDPALGPDAQVRAIATNAAGRIYIGGDFANVSGESRRGAARLLENGTLDSTFLPTNSAAAVVRTIVVEPGGLVWLGGAFNQFGGEFRSNIARVQENGLADTLFRPFPRADDEVFAMVLDNAGGIVIGGDFQSIDTFPRSRVARLLVQSTGALFVMNIFQESVLESSGKATVHLERYGTLDVQATVTLQTRDGTAVAGRDYTALNATITIPPLVLNTNVDISILDDTLPDGDEWFEVQLLQPPSSFSPTVRVTIIDNEFQATVDDTFQPEMVNAPVRATALQPDGKVLIGGEFTYRGSCLPNYLSRLTATGAVDCDFFVHSVGANGNVLTISVQTNGDIIAGGAFTYFNSEPAHYLVRLQPDGSTDPAFTISTALDSTVLATALQSDGRILVGGTFTNYDTIRQPYLLRLNTDGSFDSTFRPDLNGPVRAIRHASGGGWLIAGEFTSINGTLRSRVARLQASGSVDLTFDSSSGPNGRVLGLAEQSDGRVLIAGEFSQVNSFPRERLARLTSQGQVDPSFAVGSFGGAPRLHCVAVQSDGKVVFGGLFGSVGGQPRTFLARVLSNGLLDEGFPSAGANDVVYSVDVLPNGQLLVAGAFTEVAGIPRLRVARLNAEPTVGRLEFFWSSTNVVESVGTVTLTVRRVGPSDRTVSVDYTTVPDAAQAETDFQTRSGTLTFAPLETIKQIVVPIINDGLPEGTETFRVRLENPTGDAFLGPVHEASITILDNDAGLDVAQTSVKVREGAATASIVVRRNSDGPGSVSVDFMTVSGTAIAGSDFIATNGTLTFLPGELEKTLPIPLLSDPAFEGRESFRVLLGNPSPGIVLGTNGACTVYIEDQDSSFQFGIINDATEGEYPALCYVQRIGLLTETATIRVRSEGGTATAGLDYVPIDLRFTFAPGEYLKEFYVTNLNDGLVEGMETVRLTLSEPTGHSIVDAPGEAFSTIRDNDRGIQFIAPIFYVNEFTSNAVAIVSRGDDGNATLTVHYQTLAESASGGADFVVRSGQLSLVPGETNARVLIPILQDRLIEPIESFRIELINPGAGAALDTQSVARIIILDDERSGSLDVSFLANPNDLNSWGIYGGVSLSALPHRELVVGTGVQVTRLKPDGRADTNFLQDSFQGFLLPVVLSRPDGKILVGGSSSNAVFGVGSPCLRLLQTNGLNDPSFDFTINQGRTAAIARLDDERVVIGGDYLGFLPSGTSVLRVLPSGALDPTFAIPVFDPPHPSVLGPSTVEALIVNPDESIYAAGTFLTVNNQLRPHIVRLTPDGAVDPTFQGPAILPPVGGWIDFDLPASTIDALARQPDGKLIIGGAFTNLDGLTAHNLARLTESGTLDRSFVSRLNATQSVAACALQPDGRLLIAVNGPYIWNGPIPEHFVRRVLPDGAFDPAFEIVQTDGPISDVILMPGGDIAIGGRFTTVNGIERPMVARLRGDGLLLRATPQGASNVQLQLFNTLPGGVSVLESSSNLLDWTPIRTNTATSDLQQWIEPRTGLKLFYRARSTEP